MIHIRHRWPLIGGLLLSAAIGVLPVQAHTSVPTMEASLQALVTVTGEVVDESDEPLPGVTVRVEGLQGKGAVTDIDGHFSIQGIPADSKLIFSMIGMKTQTITIKGKSTLKVKMQEDSETLQEVVVTGYQEVKKERMTGSIATIDAADIKNYNLNTMDQVLVGTISGVSTITSGRPGAEASINIRGANSLTGSTQPVWIVDGMPMEVSVPSLNTGANLEAMLSQGGIGNIAPDDIKSITVLKDAAATAIYGARAANGVIVVTTKKGESGTTAYNLSVQMGVTERPVNNVRMMTTEEKILFERQAYEDYGSPYVGRVGMILSNVDQGIYSEEEGEARISELSKQQTDWYRVLYRPALSTRVHATMSGGTAKTTYYTSINFLNEAGTERNNLYRRLLVSTKLNHKFTDRLEAGAHLSGTYRTDRHTASAIAPLSYAMYANPYETADGYDQSWDMSQSSVGRGLKWSRLNILDDLDRNFATSRQLSLSLNAFLRWQTPIKGLTLESHIKGSAGANTSRTVEGENTYTNYQRNWLNGVNSIVELTPEMTLGSLSEGYYISDAFTWRNTADYSVTLADKHHVTLFAGNEIHASLMYSADNYSPTFDTTHRIIGYPIMPDNTRVDKLPLSRLGSTGKYESKMSSFFLNGSYSFDDRYVMSGSIRYDGSDIIGNKNQFTPLWNLSAKWNLHNEPFFTPTRILSRLSLRTGYGYTGSIDKDALPFVVAHTSRNIRYDGLTLPTSFEYANPDIRWQTKRDFNVGLETGWLGERVRLSVNYYDNFVFDLLDYRTLPLSSGRPNVKQNTANLRNRGIEADLYLELLRHGSLIWSIRGNIAYNRNKITETFHKSLSELEKSAGGQKLIQGYSVGSWFGYRFAGIEPSTGHTLAYDDEGKPFDMDLLSDATLKLQSPTLSHLGESTPPLIGGFSSDLYWGRWALNMSFEFRSGHLIPSFNTFRGLSSKSRHISDITRWRAPGDEVALPEISFINTAYSKYRYDVSLERGDYLRLTYATLSYNLPPEWLRALGMLGAKLSLTANNLFTVTGYKGIDPSLGGSFGYPNSRRYLLSLNLNF